MKEYYSIPLEDEEAQSLLDLSQLMDDKPIKPVLFLGNIDSALDKVVFGATFWYENHHVVGLRFLQSKLKKIPESIGNLSYLRFINIIETPINFIPSTFKFLNELEQFVIINDPEINFTIAIDFPDIFGFLNKLKLFYIDGSFAIFLPPSFTELKNLKELTLDKCLFFTNRNDFLKYLKKEKGVLENPINILPNNIALLNTIEKIVLNNLHIQYLPETIINLGSLKELDLSYSNSMDKSHNRKASIQNIDIVFQIKSLEKLNLAHCELNFIPKSIGNLKSLVSLNLSWNKLQELPIEIKNCQNLEKLFLQRNDFEEFFEKWINYLVQLPKLNYLTLGLKYSKLIPIELREKKDLKIKII